MKKPRGRPDRSEAVIATVVMFRNEDGTFIEVRDPQGSKYLVRCDFPEAAIDIDVNVDSGRLLSARLTSSDE